MSISINKLLTDIRELENELHTTTSPEKAVELEVTLKAQRKRLELAKKAEDAKPKKKDVDPFEKWEERKPEESDHVSGVAELISFITKREEEHKAKVANFTSQIVKTQEEITTLKTQQDEQITAGDVAGAMETDEEMEKLERKITHLKRLEQQAAQQPTFTPEELSAQWAEIAQQERDGVESLYLSVLAAKEAYLDATNALRFKLNELRQARSTYKRTAENYRLPFTENCGAITRRANKMNYAIRPNDFGFIGYNQQNNPL